MRIFDKGGRLVVDQKYGRYDLNKRIIEKKASRAERRIHGCIRTVTVVVITALFLLIIGMCIHAGMKEYINLAGEAKTEYEAIQHHIVESSDSLSPETLEEISFEIKDGVLYTTYKGELWERVLSDDDNSLYNEIKVFSDKYQCNNGPHWYEGVIGIAFREYITLVVVAVVVELFITWIVYTEGFFFEDKLALRILVARKEFFAVA